MGKIIHLSRIREFMKTTPVFRVRDIEMIVRNRKYAHLILHKLIRRNEIKRIIRGWYSLHEDPIISVFCFKPSYIGMQEALSFHNLWEQETNIVIVTTRKVRIGTREIFGNNVILHRMKQKYFFGFDYLRYEDFFIPVSDVEKTLIDLVYFNEIPGDNVLGEIKKKLNKKKLNKYLKCYPIKFKKRVHDLIL